MKRNTLVLILVILPGWLYAQVATVNLGPVKTAENPAVLAWTDDSQASLSGSNTYIDTDDIENQFEYDINSYKADMIFSRSQAKLAFSYQRRNYETYEENQVEALNTKNNTDQYDIGLALKFNEYFSFGVAHQNSHSETKYEYEYFGSGMSESGIKRDKTINSAGISINIQEIFYMGYVRYYHNLNRTDENEAFDISEESQLDWETDQYGLGMSTRNSIIPAFQIEYRILQVPETTNSEGSLYITKSDTKTVRVEAMFTDYFSLELENAVTTDYEYQSKVINDITESNSIQMSFTISELIYLAYKYQERCKETYPAVVS